MSSGTLNPTQLNPVTCEDYEQSVVLLLIETQYNIKVVSSTATAVVADSNLSGWCMMSNTNYQSMEKNQAPNNELNLCNILLYGTELRVAALLPNAF